MCVCVCARARARVRVCVCVYVHIHTNMYMFMKIRHATFHSHASIYFYLSYLSCELVRWETHLGHQTFSSFESQISQKPKTINKICILSEQYDIKTMPLKCVRWHVIKHLPNGFKNHIIKSFETLNYYIHVNCLKYFLTCQRLIFR